MGWIGTRVLSGFQNWEKWHFNDFFLIMILRLSSVINASVQKELEKETHVLPYQLPALLDGRTSTKAATCFML